MRNKSTRREFLAKDGPAMSAVVGAAVLALGATRRARAFLGLFGKKIEKLDPDQNGDILVDWKKEAYTALSETGGAVKVAVKGLNRPIIVIRTSENSATALSSECTHRGCEVGLPVDGSIRCPCHHSQFSLTGERLAGPAKKPLEAFPATVDTERATISVSGVAK